MFESDYISRVEIVIPNNSYVHCAVTGSFLYIRRFHQILYDFPVKL